MDNQILLFPFLIETIWKNISSREFHLRCKTNMDSAAPLCGPLVLLLLEEFHLVVYNSTGLLFVIQKFEMVGGLSLYIVLYREASSYFYQNLYFAGRTSHPSLVPLLLLIYFLFLVKKKKKKRLVSFGQLGFSSNSYWPPPVL